MRAKLDVDEIVQLYTAGWSAQKIADSLGCSQPTILNRLHTAGASIRFPFVQSDVKTEDIIRLYKTHSAAKTGELLGCSEHTVLDRLRKAECRVRPAGTQQKHSWESAFAVIDTEEKAYWLGYILADGNVHFPPQKKYLPRFQVGITERYKYHLIKLRDFLHSDHKITLNNTVCVLPINSRILVNDLIRHGVAPRKSHEFQGWKGVPDFLQRHLLRGLFDGDGYVGIRKEKYSDIPCVHLVGHRKCLERVRDIFSGFCHHYPKITKPTAAKSACVGEMKWGSRADCTKILHYLYDDATVCFERKKRMADEIISRWDGLEYREREIK